MATAALFASTFTFCIFAAPGTLSQTPLVGQTNAISNIMVLLDSSGSMATTRVLTPTYNASTQPTCPGTGKEMYSYISSINGGKAMDPNAPRTVFYGVYMNAGVLSLKYITYLCDNKGCGSSTMITGYIPLTNIGTTTGKGCFQAGGNPTYGPYTFSNVTLQGRAVNTIPPYVDALSIIDAPFTNWYYSAAASNWVYNSTNSNYDNTLAIEQSRYDLAKSVLNNFTNQQLHHVNVGVAIFEPPPGILTPSKNALILLAPANVDNNTNVFNSLSLGNPYGNTPLASAMSEIGRYIIGNYSGNLVLHPGQSNETSLSVSSVFPYLPKYATGVNTDSPLTAWCQKTFLLVISDGVPQSDSNFSSYLQNYLNGTSTNAAIDDVAKALYEMDLRPDLNDDKDQPYVNNIVTYTIGFSAAPAGVAALQAAAAVGGGTYADAANFDDLAAAVQAVGQVIISKLASGSSIAFNSTSLQQDSALYKAFYMTGLNTGDLQKVSVNIVTGAVSSTPIWSFQTLLQAKTPSTRFMFTNVGPKTPALLTSTNLTSLTATQQADLNQGPTTVDNLGASRIDYIRGANVTGFRVRDKILGDIVNSSPIYVKSPIVGLYPSDTSYSTFVTNNANRAAMVYIGDNSGVFHAIDATTGDEKFGYLPLNLFSNATGAGYHYLTDPAYQHRFYINGAYGIGDAYLNSAWQTVLVSGEGAGGKGYFSLNVTNPNNFTSGNESNIFKWEFSSSNDSDLGYTFSKPIIGKMNDGNWYAIFGNGYNSTNGIAKLFLVKLAGPSGATWVKNTDYYVLTTGSGSTSTPDGLSSPAAVDLDNNGTIDRIYAGSVQGTMWSFNVSSTSPGSWGNGVALINTGQPITGAPLVTTHPTITATSGNAPDVMVFFGTGQYLTSTDPTSTTTTGLYGVWDNGGATATTAQLVTQTLTTSGTQRTVSNNTVDYTTKRGWTIALTGGERAVEQPGLGNTTVFFATMQPQGASSTPCTTNNGVGWVLAVDAGTGGAGNGGTQVLDTDMNGTVTAADKSNGSVVVGMQFTAGYPNAFGFFNSSLYAPLSDGSIAKIVVNIGGGTGPTGRISEEELRPPGS